MSKIVPFILHTHNPRSGSQHFDLRFLDSKNPKLLHSFAFGSKFLDSLDSKISAVKTRDHDIRWLTLKSYRLKTLDEGNCEIKIQRGNYFELVFDGKLLKGTYRLFALKTRRGDQWLFIKDKRVKEMIDKFCLVSKILKEKTGEE
jgi:hypothetical protein